MAAVPNNDQRVVFEQSVEGLIRALGDKLDQKCAERLRAVGIDLGQKLKVAYPVESWVAALWIAGETIAPGFDKDEATYQVGRRFIRGYETTLMGKATTAMAKVVGPKRTLERMTRNFRTGSSYGTSKMTELGPQKYEVWCFPVAVPGFYRGLLEGGLEIAGAKNAKVTLARWEKPEEAVFEATWS